ncbi:uncharacterized protein L969DRAFT_47129 [Mixia osmundae IAM 14324]|uniref:J domain-containing protein n=1 Tax=Mixia osmundae (strain CBS 9802 / IAM 14324 / JCM 22182 / KY 12970) TaxID=764103 RepID=G7E9C1_MIXOS|nr:uncharacterized protein L969DRAFT_47129 [Mixia osmundae IAM 14324]KEI39867.1 hypothetical protein L969DRAFT_47129 [Mixia osmundae IAM 14324]GAA99240.1 hypothetical protein E5Q_05934 [Mixia osmundae IAM 14324]
MAEPPAKDPYELLSVANAATLAEIKSAYRKQSLKVHPDRNPGNAQAAAQFHELTLAYELLQDPVRRASHDKLQAHHRAKAQRFASLDKKRKTDLVDLEARERAYKLSKESSDRQTSQRGQEVERLKSEAQRMKEALLQSRRNNAPATPPPSVARVPEDAQQTASLESTVRLRWRKKYLPDLDSQARLKELLASLGAVESIVLAPVKADAKSNTALVVFGSIAAAVRAVRASATPNTAFEHISITWAGEPPSRAGKLPTQSDREVEVPPAASVTLEELTLGRLREREAERARLMAELAEQDAST